MRLQEQYESQQVEAYARLDDITLAAHGITPETVASMFFLGRALKAMVATYTTIVWPWRDTCRHGKAKFFGRSLCPHRERGTDTGGWHTRRH